MTRKVVQQCCEDLWLIAHSAYESLRMWEAIAIHAGEVNKAGKHVHFWGSCQRLAISHAIVDICKLYKNSKDPKEQTLHKLKKLAQIDVILPDSKKLNSPLERIFRYRDKILVHKEEYLSVEIYEENKKLPSIEEFYKLVELAKTVCVSTGYEAPSAITSLRNATKNVLYKVITSPPIKDIEGDYNQFMKRDFEK